MMMIMIVKITPIKFDMAHVLRRHLDCVVNIFHKMAVQCSVQCEEHSYSSILHSLLKILISQIFIFLVGNKDERYPLYYNPTKHGSWVKKTIGLSSEHISSNGCAD